MESWARECKICYLDGAIMSYPSGIGSAECTIIYSGSRELLDRMNPVLLALGGNAGFAGNAIGHASALDLTLLNFALSNMFGFLAGYIVCEEEGLPADAFMGSVKGLLPGIEEILTGISTRIRNKDYAGYETTVEGWSVGSKELMQWGKEHRVAQGMARAQHGLFEKAMKAGRDQDDIASLYEIMRKAES